MNGRDEIFSKGEVSLIISDYDKIFSSFDPRPHGERALSVDFIAEAKRATREISPDQFELRLLLPAKGKSFDKEKAIKKRLHEHSLKHFHMLEKEKKGIIKEGASFVVSGIIAMFVAAWILYSYTELSLFGEFIIVLLEPGGWFLFWEGLDLLIFEAKKDNPDLEFYRKMLKAEVVFMYH